MNWNKIFYDLSSSVMDCLEACLTSLTLATGKRMKYVFFICILFLAGATVMYLLKLPAFITLDEAISAVIISGLLTLMDSSNRYFIKNIKEKLNKK